MTANVETMAYRYADRSDVPWHGLGTKVDRNEEVGTYEFMVRAGADWNIVKRKLYYFETKEKYEKSLKSEYPDRYALIREDNGKALHIVSSQYKPIQNATIFDFFREFCAAGDMTIETAGILDEGRKVWVLASLREGFTLANNDLVTGHLLLSDARDGSACRGKFTAIRVVCANTLGLALSEDSGRGEYRLNHRTRFDPYTVKQQLGLAHEQLGKFKEQADFLVSKSLSRDGFRAFLAKLFPVREEDTGDGDKRIIVPYAHERVERALVEAPGADLNSGTWWSALNAVTYDVDHRDRKDKAGQLDGAWFGAGAKLKEKALTLALEMAR